MKTAVSIPDPLFKSAEELAARLGISRSALYAQALEAHVKKRRGEEVTEQLNAALAKIPPEEQVDPFVQAAAIHLLKNVEW